MSQRRRYDNDQPRVKAWRKLDGYQKLKQATRIANELADDAGIHGDYIIDTTEAPFAVTFCQRGICDTVAWWTPSGLQMTENGAMDDEWAFAVESVGL